MIINKKKFLLCLLSVIFFVTSFFAIGYQTLFAKSEGTWSEIGIQEIYSIGDEITVPERKVTVSGTEYDATCTVVFPSGAVQQTDKFVVKESGEYKLMYKAVVDGKAFEKTVKFLVNNTLYSVSDAASTATYGTNSYLPDTVNGINLSLAAGDKFTFNKVIDLTEKTREDKICKFYLTPKNTGEPDVARVKITLTDIYDPNNFVVMTYKLKILSSVNYSTIYRAVNANNQPAVGLHYQGSVKGDDTDDTTYIQYGRYWFTANRNPIYGAGVTLSSDGIARNIDFIDNYEYLAMDYAERQVFAQKHWFNFEPYNLIADLDDYRMMGNTLWDGFTTGECLLSIEGENYISSSLNMFITEIADYDLTDFDFKDDRAPSLAIDFGDYTEASLPKAIVNKPYRVFNGTAYDNLDGEMQPTVKVYYNYYSDMRTLVSLKNGAFTPKKSGVYTVIYTAKDSVGNESTSSYDVEAIVPAQDFKITANEISSAVAASRVRLGGYVVENNNGYYTVKVTATLKSDSNISYEIDARELAFVPLYAGDYEISYTATDYVETVEYDYTLSVSSPTAPQIVAEANLPRYLIKGAKYTFEGLVAYSYTAQGRTEIATELYAIEDEATEEKKLEKNAYMVTANTEVELVYKAKDAQGNVGVKRYTIPVVDVAYGQSQMLISEYFQGEGFTADKGSVGVVYTKQNAQGETKLSYIQSALLDGFKMELQFVDEYMDYEKLTLVLSENGNANNALRISFAKTAEAFNCFVHDSTRTYAIAYSEDMKTLTVSYDKRSNQVIFNGSVTVQASACGFDGFDGYFVDLDLVFEKPYGNVGVEIAKLYMQPFSTVASDYINPQILEYNKSATRCRLNETTTIAAPYFFDVLDPNVSATLTVLTPTGEAVVAKDGTVLSNADARKDYEIELTEYGVWSVVYQIEDKRGNAIMPSYVIRVEDNIPPTVTIVNPKTSYKQGDKLVLPTVDISDNYSANAELVKAVLVRTPSSVVVYVNESGLMLSEKGEYIVYYYVTDEAGNLTVEAYAIKVGG